MKINKPGAATEKERKTRVSGENCSLAA
jgi:hypothetical protein